MSTEKRCDWAKGPLDIEYHDAEWGHPTGDDRLIFELLILEGMQAGLSWNTILRKRKAFRDAFDGFDPHLVAAYDPEKVEELMGNAAIIRNRRKIEASIQNAKAFLAVQKEFGSFACFIWSFVKGEQVVNHWQLQEEMPATSPLSEQVSKALLKRGFRFVGPTICYSFLQAIGVINDHLVTCPFHAACQKEGMDFVQKIACP